VTAWVRSRRCDSGTCVEARRVGDVVEVRDSKQDDSPILRFTREEWAAFLAGAADGDFNFFNNE